MINEISNYGYVNKSVEFMFDRLPSTGIIMLSKLYEYIIVISSGHAARGKKVAFNPGITLHLDCTKIYLLVLMVACRHRHASFKVAGSNKETFEKDRVDHSHRSLSSCEHEKVHKFEKPRLISGTKK